MMFTEEEFLEAQSIMDEALARAKLVLGGFYGEEATAKVEILEDGRARVTSWDTEYEESGLQEQVEYFPANLLFCPMAEAVAWVDEQKRKEEAERAALRLAHEQRLEADERARYERLKAKYERE